MSTSSAHESLPAAGQPKLLYQAESPRRSGIFVLLECDDKGNLEPTGDTLTHPFDDVRTIPQKYLPPGLIMRL